MPATAGCFPTLRTEDRESSAAAENLPPLWRRRRRPSSDEPGRVTYQEVVAMRGYRTYIASSSAPPLTAETGPESLGALRGARAVSGMSLARPVWFVRILSASQVSARPFAFSHCDSTIVPANTSTARSARGGLHDAMSDAAARRPVGRPSTRNTHGVSVNGRATMVSHI